MNRKSVRFRLTVWYSVILIVSIVVIFSSFYWITQQELYRHTDLLLKSHGSRVAEMISSQSQSLDNLTGSRLLFDEFGDIPGMLVIITDGTGSIIQSTQPAVTIASQTSFLLKKVKDSDLELFINQTFSGSELRMIVIPIVDKGKTAFVVMMGHPIDVIQKSLHSLLINLIASFFLFVIPTIFGGFVIAKRVMQPIVKMSTQMQKITSENFRKYYGSNRSTT